VAVPFYERFCRMLAASGRLRRSGQTVREFAADMSPVAGGPTGEVGWEPIAQEVTELYYSIRFGGHCPEAGEIAEIEGDLDRLETALRGGGTTA
jgi:hypothetical protein